MRNPRGRASPAATKAGEEGGMRFAFGRGKNGRERQLVVKGARFGKRPLQGSYLAALRRSFGVASQRREPLGGTRRLSSTRATPAFFSAVM